MTSLGGNKLPSLDKQKVLHLLLRPQDPAAGRNSSDHGLNPTFLSPGINAVLEKYVKGPRD